MYSKSGKTIQYFNDFENISSLLLSKIFQKTAFSPNIEWAKECYFPKLQLYLPISEHFLHRQIVLHGAQLDENREDQIKMLSNDP